MTEIYDANGKLLGGWPDPAPAMQVGHGFEHESIPGQWVVFSVTHRITTEDGYRTIVCVRQKEVAP